MNGDEAIVRMPLNSRGKSKSYTSHDILQTILLFIIIGGIAILSVYIVFAFYELKQNNQNALVIMNKLIQVPDVTWDFLTNQTEQEKLIGFIKWLIKYTPHVEPNFILNNTI